MGHIGFCGNGVLGISLVGVQLEVYSTGSPCPPNRNIAVSVGGAQYVRPKHQNPYYRIPSQEIIPSFGKPHIERVEAFAFPQVLIPRTCFGNFLGCRCCSQARSGGL